MREQYPDIIEEARQSKMDYEEFLARLLEVEDEGKTFRRTQNLLHKAKFDTTASLKKIDYNFNHSLNKAQIEELGRLGFIDAKENIIIIGPPGVGKSMIAMNITVQ